MKNLKLTIIILGVLLVGIGFLAFGVRLPTPPTSGPQVKEQVEIGKPVPDVPLTDFSGNTIKVSDYKGKAVVVDFWAGWCPFCLEEMVELEKAFGANRENLIILGIHRTDTESKEKGAFFASERGVTYPLITDSDGRLYDTFRQGIKAMPLAVFIDKEGVVREIKFGPKTALEIEQKVAKLLE